MSALNQIDIVADCVISARSSTSRSSRSCRRPSRGPGRRRRRRRWASAGWRSRGGEGADRPGGRAPRRPHRVGRAAGEDSGGDQGRGEALAAVAEQAGGEARALGGGGHVGDGALREATSRSEAAAAAGTRGGGGGGGGEAPASPRPAPARRRGGGAAAAAGRARRRRAARRGRRSSSASARWPRGRRRECAPPPAPPPARPADRPRLPRPPCRCLRQEGAARRGRERRARRSGRFAPGWRAQTETCSRRRCAAPAIRRNWRLEFSDAGPVPAGRRDAREALADWGAAEAARGELAAAHGGSARRRRRTRRRWRRRRRARDREGEARG